MKKLVILLMFLGFLHAQQIELTAQEKQYLISKKTLIFCSHNDLLPYEAIKDKKHIGIVEEYIRLISKRIDKKIDFLETKDWHESYSKTVENSCDFLSTIIKTKEREEILNFTNPYIFFPFVLATNINAPFMDDIQSLKGKKIAIVKGFASTNILKENYPFIEFIDVKNLKDGLDATLKEEVYGAIDSLAVIGYEIQNNYMKQLKISGKMDMDFKLSMATNINNEILSSILNKALDSITSEEKQKIYNMWFYVNYQQDTDFKENIIKIVSILVILFVLFIIFYREYLLKEMNKNLKKRIDFEVEEKHKNYTLLMQQSKMAAMGEMLENIAHQWRQPLSTISVCASGMELKKSLNSLEDDEFYDSINHIKNSVNYLSDTIEDFRNFFDEEKELVKVSSVILVKKVIDILNPSLIEQKIEIVKDIEDFDFFSYESKIIQSLLNVLNNAIDALKDKESEDSKYIFIEIKKDSKFAIITIKDNALGIKNDIIDRVFEPYFTTKHKFQGAGIGLYMTKLFIEKHLEGEIFIENDDFVYENIREDGAKITIKLPLNIIK